MIDLEMVRNESIDGNRTVLFSNRGTAESLRDTDEDIIKTYIKRNFNIMTRLMKDVMVGDRKVVITLI